MIALDKSAVKGWCMYVTKHVGFAMILAIFIIVLVALGGVMLLSKASVGNKSISDNYMRTQADLLAQSATEYALMRAQDINTSAVGNPCLNQLNIIVNDASGFLAYDVNASLSYSFEGDDALASGCNAIADMTGKETMVLIDVTVSDRNLSTEPIRIHKRSWQKL